MTAGMWISTGTGESKKRSLAGVTAAPLASSASRSDPKITGMMLMKIKPAGTSQPVRERLATVAVPVVSVSMA